MRDVAQRLARVQAAKKRPPREWNGKTSVPVVPMPGPNAPDPKFGQGVLPPKAAKNGAYFLPGFGDVARAKNRKRARRINAFNPGPGGTNSA